MFPKPIMDSIKRAKLPPSSQRGFLPFWLSRSPYAPVPDQEWNAEGTSVASEVSSPEDGHDMTDKEDRVSLGERTRVIVGGLIPPFRVALLLAVLFTGSLALVFALTSPHADQVAGEKQCGSSPDEARERGCLFEPQLSAWVPSQCGFDEIVHEFQETFGDMHVEWPWYWDTNITRRVQPAQVPLLQDGNFSVIYTTYHQSHDLHCLYCWRKVSYALEHGLEWMDARCHQFYHARHCVEHIGNSLVTEDDKDELQKWAYPLMYHNCFPIGSTTES